VANVLDELACLASRAPDDTHVLLLAGAASELRATLGATPGRVSQGMQRQAIDTARCRLSPAAADTAWNTGRNLSLADLVRVVADAGRGWGPTGNWTGPRAAARRRRGRRATLSAGRAPR
jgi:hypothetical protein